MSENNNYLSEQELMQEQIRQMRENIAAMEEKLAQQKVNQRQASITKDMSGQSGVTQPSVDQIPAEISDEKVLTNQTQVGDIPLEQIQTAQTSTVQMPTGQVQTGEVSFGQTDNQGKPKKKFYKKWWFWVVVVLLIGAIGAAGGSGGSDKSSTSNQTTLSNQKTTPKEEAKEEAKIASIVAEYSGSTEAGTVLDENNTGIKVVANLEDGTTKDVISWTVEQPVELVAESESTVKILYEDLACDLTVKCTTVSEETYKNSCQSIAYSDLARTPDNYKGQNITIYGQVIQVLDEGNSVTLRVATKDSGYGNYYDDVVLVTYEYKANEPKILEEDMITLWGSYYGTYTYESTMGGNITIPAMNAEYYSL